MLQSHMWSLSIVFWSKHAWSNLVVLPWPKIKLFLPKNLQRCLSNCYKGYKTRSQADSSCCEPRTAILGSEASNWGFTTICSAAESSNVTSRSLARSHVPWLVKCCCFTLGRDSCPLSTQLQECFIICPRVRSLWQRNDSGMTIPHRTTFLSGTNPHAHQGAEGVTDLEGRLVKHKVGFSMLSLRGGKGRCLALVGFGIVCTASKIHFM